MYDGILLCVIVTVDEAMHINKKLTSANGKQEATIVSLKKVCGKVNYLKEDVDISNCGSHKRLLLQSPSSICYPISQPIKIHVFPRKSIKETA